MDLRLSQSRIQKLSPLLINQLAAGEVVTRPASVVKELLENAIDAGATKIDIRITQGGMGVIEISDNGSGIHPEDMQMAITRHATSKVADVESLYGISTLGFRGEALASIAAVSRLSLTSSHDGSGVGRCLTVAGVIEGDADIVPCVCQQGTTVTVKDLYFNVPARRGNLKNVATEYAHIEAVIRQIALVYADIDLTLYHEGKKRLTLTAQTDKSSQAQLNRLGQAVSACLPKQAYPLSVDLSGLVGSADNSATNCTATIDGWIWLDDDLQANADLPKLIYINERLVKDISISQQVRQAVNSLNIASQAVGYALFFVLPSDWCNLNVHPSKQRINIHALTNINAHLYQAIRSLLQPQIADISLNTNHLQDSSHIQDASHIQNANRLELASELDEQTDDDMSVCYTDKSTHQGVVKPSHAVHSPSAVYQVDGNNELDLNVSEVPFDILKEIMLKLGYQNGIDSSEFLAGWDESTEKHPWAMDYSISWKDDFKVGLNRIHEQITILENMDVTDIKSEKVSTKLFMLRQHCMWLHSFFDDLMEDLDKIYELYVKDDSTDD